MQIELNRQSIVDQPLTTRLLEHRQDSIELPPLPADLSPLIGRDSDLERLLQLVNQPDVRLVSLTGGGGIGKTRLAIAAAARFAEIPGADAGLLPLDHLQEREQIPGAISSYLRLSTCGAESLLDFLASAVTFPLLLVLDNFEQISDGGIFLIDVLAASPMITLLVTGRSPIHIRGEHEFRLEPLSVTSVSRFSADEGKTELPPAVSLFVERAQAVSPNIRFDENRLKSVSEICTLLDGFPLAIEIAAARCRLLPPESMLLLLRKRLSFLTGGPRDAPDRHQTVRNTIQWTYDLLPPRTQHLFRFLSVFPGGFTFKAAAKIAAEISPGEEGAELDDWILDEIELLSDFNLLRITSLIELSDENSRFRFYETIRAFGQEKLAEAGETEQAFFLLEQWSREISEQAGKARFSAVTSFFDTLESEYPNIRAAIEWLAEQGEARRGFQILHGLAWFMTERYLLSEAIKWTNFFLTADEIQLDPSSHAEALHTSALIRYWCSNYAEAVQLHERALALWRSIGDRNKTATSLLNLANVMFDNDDLDRASALLTESLEIRRETGDLHGQSHALTLLGRIALARGDRSAARDLYQTALQGFTEINHPTWISFVQENLGLLELVEGDDESALCAYQAAISIGIEYRDHWRISSCLLGFAELAHRSSSLELAVRLYAAAESSLLQMEIRIRKATELLFAGWFAELRTQVEPALFDSAWYAGSGLDRDEAAKLALTVTFERPSPSLTHPGSHRDSSTQNAAVRAGLTPREVEILLLLSRGLANRDIAQELSISHRTVMQHLSNIFSKIEVTSRTAAAAWAHHHYLV